MRVTGFGGETGERRLRLLPALASVALLSGCAFGTSHPAQTATRAAEATVATEATSPAPGTPSAAAAWPRHDQQLIVVPTQAAVATAAAPAGGQAAASASGLRLPERVSIDVGRAAASAGGGTASTEVQRALNAAGLQPADLPADFTSAGSAGPLFRSTTLAGSYGAAFVRGAGAGGYGEVVIELIYDFGSPHGAAAVLDEIDADPQGFIFNTNVYRPTAERLSDGAGYGDAASSFHVGLYEYHSCARAQGYVVAWRRGPVLTVLMDLGVPPVTSIDLAASIAARQDQRVSSSAGLAPSD
jgi:hypothetical protein